jgi:protein-tyrosine phosphatase
MTRQQKQVLAASYPDFADRIFLLGEYAGQPEEVTDPYGGSAEDYLDTANQLVKLLEALFAKLQAVASESEETATDEPS